MQSVDTQRLGLIKARKGVTKPGKFFTPAETLRNVVKERERKARRSEGIGLLTDAKSARRAEVANKAQLKSAIAKKRELGFPATCPIKKDAEGRLYCQPRVKGRFGPRVIVG